MNKFLNILLVVMVLQFITNMAFAQQAIVTGVVIDDQATPLPGVTVVVAGTTNGAITSIDGKYVLVNVRKGDTIQFSFIGFKPERRVVQADNVINVILQTSSELLDDVQVVAFQKQKKESVIASINTIKPSELKIPSSNLTTALAGKMSGVIAYQRSGEPGKDNAEFFIRGVTSFGYKNNPLILIDGLEVNADDLARVEPDNIASFSIMKDATATSLYGARGANGVVLVTTKEGKKGKAKVSVRYESNVATPTMMNDFLDGVQYMKLYNEAVSTRGSNLELYSKSKIEGTENKVHPEAYPNVDWYGELFNNYTINQKANLNVSGGGEVVSYYLSTSYTNETGLLKVDPLNSYNNNIDIDRYNLMANLNIKLTKTTEISAKFSSVFDQYNGPLSNGSAIFEKVILANPVEFPKYYSKTEDTKYNNHTLFGNNSYDGSDPNPYYEMVKGYKDQYSASIISQFQLKQDLSFLISGLEFRGIAAIKNYSGNENLYYMPGFFYRADNIYGNNYTLTQLTEGQEYLGFLSGYQYNTSNFYFEGVVQYDKTFNDKHNLGALLVGYRSENLNKGTDYFSGFPSRNLGLSGRLTYSFSSRYFTELNFGYNGSEKFAENHRFGFFPAGAVGWIVSNEKFWQNIKPFVNMLKLKYTYGLVGNDGISAPGNRFFYMSEVNLDDPARGYTFGQQYNNNYPGYIINRYENPGVTWELAYKSNYGIELGLFDMMEFQVDYFTEFRDNIYMQIQSVPATMGSTSEIWSNVGEARSQGVDASLDINHAFTPDFWVTGRANFTYATNKIIKNGEPDYQYSYMSSKGYPINQPRGYVAQRLFVDDEEAINSPVQFDATPGVDYGAGDIKYVDINNDGRIDSYDMAPIGFPTVPEIVYGFGSSVGYKNIDISFFFQGSARQSFFMRTEDGWENDELKLGITPFIGKRNALAIIADNHWSENNPDPYAFWPRLSAEPLSADKIENNTVPSTWWLRDGSFLRLKSVELGYTLPKQLTNKFNLTMIRVYFSGINLLTFSKFKLWDPEMAGNGLSYPTQKVYNFGIQANF